MTVLPWATEPGYGADGTSYQIDQRIRAVVQEGLSVYRVDADVLRDAAPDLIITQEQCRVCAVSTDELAEAVAEILGVEGGPAILSLDPGDLDRALADMVRIGGALGLPDEGAGLVAGMRDGLARVTRDVGEVTPVRVLLLEWMDPLMVAGNWMPELVEVAGGEVVLGRAGEHSPFVAWEDLRNTEPDVVVIIPCGFSVERTLEEVHLLEALPGWSRLQDGRVAVADGHHFFNRPGPRLVDSARILAEIFHESVDYGYQARGAWRWMSEAGE